MGGVWAQIGAGEKKSMSEVANKRINENLLILNLLMLEDSRGNRSGEKGPKSS
jgi:hypothetical protein